MMSLFSSFDLFLFKLPYFSFYFISSLMFYSFWLKSIINSFLSAFYLAMVSFFKSVMSFKFKVIDVMLLSLMAFIFLFNICSIFPFNFSFTSQVSFNFYWGLSLWLSLMLFSIIFNIKYILIHFIPEGTPLFLIWFLFFVELVSNVIRPLTLVVRLLANILAGHLLMILLSKMVFIFSPFLIFYVFLNLVEFFVSLIQSYIFVTMVILYFSEMF